MTNDVPLDDLYRNWRARNPSKAELSESVQAVRSAWDDFQAGDKGRPARAALRDITSQLGLVIGE